MATPKMRTDLLLLLAKKLLWLAKKDPKKFDITTWGEQVEERQGQTPTKLSCATTACAVGTAMLMPEFRKKGLKADIREDGFMAPVFKGHRNFNAVEAFFRIDGDQARYLFDPDYYADKDARGKQGLETVAARIEYFVKTGGRYIGHNPTS